MPAGVSRASESQAYPDQIGGEMQPAPGSDIGALDLRAAPSSGRTGAVLDSREHVSRDEPLAGGRAVGPMRDLTIQVYDLPDQPADYDRTQG